jgi:hypothetical protein
MSPSRRLDAAGLTTAEGEDAGGEHASAQVAAAAGRVHDCVDRGEALTFGVGERA